MCGCAPCPSLDGKAEVKPHMLTSSIFANMDRIRHGFFTREGGHSDGIYASLNCGPGSSDNVEKVGQNRTRVAEEIGVTSSGLVTLYQVHSSSVAIVDQPWKQSDAPQADAMVSAVPDIALGILTADCVPVLFADPDAGVIGAAHAGWKGASGGVLEATIAAMEEMDADARRIHAAIGPCIRQQSYEVSNDFMKTIVALHMGNTRFFTKGMRGGHFQFDLPGYVYARLDNLGVGHIDDLSIDTYTDERRFFSYRRMTHRHEPDYGRQISVITLESP